MIRLSEAVLPGHPDKFCDLVADAIVREATRIDKESYAQVEVAIWSDQMWISGGVVTRRPFDKDLGEIVAKVGASIGLTADNWIDASRYKIHSTLCREERDPDAWTRYVNDQSIVIGWAGYDAKVGYMPPEHFLALMLRDGLFASCRKGALKGHGPDGKLLVRMREQGAEFHVEHILVTLQQKRDADFMELLGLIVRDLEAIYKTLQARDPRWATPFGEIDLLINPNGPLLAAGSDGDNGQTGRKLAMDYYGPRIPIGGGALCGKHWTHIDRLAAKGARRAALLAVKTGARECKVTLAYAPNQDRPLDMVVEMDGRGTAPEIDRLSHSYLYDLIQWEHAYEPMISPFFSEDEAPIRFDWS